MLIGGEMLKRAVENGAGWRADCLGDMGGFSKTWCHMRMAYLDAVREVFSDAPKDHVDLLPKDVGMGPYDRAYK